MTPTLRCTCTDCPCCGPSTSAINLRQPRADATAARTTATTTPAFAHAGPQWQRTARRAKRLSWLSLLYMGIEGGVAIAAAIVAGSVALLGFGIDSAIEGLASIIVVWRFSGARTLSETAERHAQRAVAISFFLLAPYIAYDAINTLGTAHHPHISWVGIGICAFSLVWMPVLGTMKKRLGAQLNSDAVAGEGTQNLLCAYLAAAVLVGLLANAALGWWWFDPAVALGIAAVAVHEGREAWAGEDCC